MMLGFYDKLLLTHTVYVNEMSSGSFQLWTIRLHYSLSHENKSITTGSASNANETQTNVNTIVKCLTNVLVKLMCKKTKQLARASCSLLLERFFETEEHYCKIHNTWSTVNEYTYYLLSYNSFNMTTVQFI